MSAYLSSLSLLKLVRNMPGGIAQGLIWGLMALGIYITFRLLDVADLTVDGSFTTGGAVTVMLILAGWPAWAALLVAILVGMLAGLCTGLLHTKFGIPAILSGILTQFALYSINLRIMGMAANKAVSVDKYHLVLSSRNVPLAILTAALISVALVSVFYWYFGTEQGSALRATGNNPAMSRALGININHMKVLGLSLSNGVVALAGGLMSQYQGFADINMDRGASHRPGRRHYRRGNRDRTAEKVYQFLVHAALYRDRRHPVLHGGGRRALAAAELERPEALYGDCRCAVSCRALLAGTPHQFLCQVPEGGEDRCLT